MIDIHTHILPNVDDGSSSLETSKKMIELEKNDGVDKIILTPHYFKNALSQQDKNKIKTEYQKFITIFKETNIEFILGAEIYFSNEIYQELRDHSIMCLGNSNYVLIEFSLTDEYYNILDVMNDVICLGYKPILAHPERYSYLSINDIVELKEIGCLIQINTSSILGDFGRYIQKKTFKMIKKDLVDFIASDAHSTNIRKPNLKETLSFVEKKFKKRYENKIDL